jgi:hypothetical protein
VLVALFSCLLIKLFLQIDILRVEDGTMTVLNAFCLRGLVGHSDFASVVFLMFGVSKLLQQMLS